MLLAILGWGAGLVLSSPKSMRSGGPRPEKVGVVTMAGRCDRDELLRQASVVLALRKLVSNSVLPDRPDGKI